MLNRLIKFIKCLISSVCEYSIKKILAYVFSILVIIVVLCTDKEYGELLIFIGALIGARSYDKLQKNKLNTK